MFRPDGWNKIAWQNGVCMSAQDFSAHKTGAETPVQMQFTELASIATSVSGTPIGDMGTANFKTICEDACQEVAIGAITPEEYAAKLTEACK